jgi:hypothetical protein
MNRNTITLAIPLAALALLAAASSVSSQEQPGLADTWSELPCLQPQQWGDPSTDRASCEQECRSRYGVSPYAVLHRWGGGGGWSGGYRVYANCIAECDKQFWQRFDRQTEDLK